MNRKKPFEWDELKLKAANLLAEGDLSQDQISSLCGMSLSKLKRTMKESAFQEKIKEITDDIDVTLKKNRIKLIKREIKRVVSRLNLNEDKPTSRDLVALVKLAGEESGDYAERKDINVHGDLRIIQAPELRKIIQDQQLDEC